MALSLTSYRMIGRSGLAVSPLCLGTMGFGDPAGLGMSRDAAKGILGHYLGAGGNFIDTANLYAGGQSETIIGDYFKGSSACRDRVVIATKFSGSMQPGDPNAGGAGRKSIITACEQSLRRLQTDYIDLYWLHWEDPFVPVEETMRALDDLVRGGKVLYVGLSDISAWKAAKAQTTALLRGWAPVAALQFEYSLLERTAEGEILPMAEEYGIGATPWGPLCGGMLSGKYRRGGTMAAAAVRQPRIDRHATPETFLLLDRLEEIAQAHGATIAAVALAWLIRHPQITAPIIGPKSVEQLIANLAALEVELSAAECGVLDEITRPQLNFPAHFLNAAFGRSYPGLRINGRAY